MSENNLNWLANFIWSIADDVLRDVYVRGKYRDVILPMTVIRPLPVLNTDGTERLPALDNHAMGTIFEELIRRFNEENNEEAGEHFTPRDVVSLMADLIFVPVADQIESGTYLVYDGACGTGGMVTVAEERLGRLAREHGQEVSIHLFGQEVNAFLDDVHIGGGVRIVAFPLS
jgi:type I restriction enzyme M protein